MINAEDIRTTYTYYLSVKVRYTHTQMSVMLYMAQRSLCQYININSTVQFRGEHHFRHNIILCYANVTGSH